MGSCLYLAVQNGVKEASSVDLLTGRKHHFHLVVVAARMVQVYSTQILHTIMAKKKKKNITKSFNLIFLNLLVVSNIKSQPQLILVFLRTSNYICKLCTTLTIRITKGLA